MLPDRFNRIHDYLRISLTNNCNLRCFYCMPEENHQVTPSSQLMQANEIEELAGIFVSLGVNKIRLTGGEPLVRKDAAQIIHAVSRLPVSLSITTNGVRLHHFLPVLKASGVRSLNISLDTLNADRFRHITRRNDFNRVWTNIEQAVKEGMHVKLNVVAMKGINDEEINDFVDLTRRFSLHVRFIEFMPFSGNQWNKDKVFSLQDILEKIKSRYSFEKLKDGAHDTTKSYQVPGYLGTIAVISSMTDHFCATCNRIRLTADGKIKNCLFSKEETDLLTAFRNGSDVRELIRKNIMQKAAAHGGQFAESVNLIDAKMIDNRSMISIGG